MYLMREEANASLPQIGEVLGGRDHTTVMYACDKVADMIERDDRLRRQVIQIRERLYGRPGHGLIRLPSRLDVEVMIRAITSWRVDPLG